MAKEFSMLCIPMKQCQGSVIEEETSKKKKKKKKGKIVHHPKTSIQQNVSMPHLSLSQQLKCITHHLIVFTSKEAYLKMVENQIGDPSSNPG